MKETYSYRAVVVERSRALLNHSSHAQGRGFQSGHLPLFIEREMVEQEQAQQRFSVTGATRNAQIPEMDQWMTLQQGISYTLELDWNGQVELLQLAASHTSEDVSHVYYKNKVPKWQKNLNWM